MQTPASDTDSSPPGDKLNPLEAYTLADLARLVDFVEEEKKRLSGAPLSSPSTGREGEHTEAGEGFGERRNGKQARTGRLDEQTEADASTTP